LTGVLTSVLCVLQTTLDAINESCVTALDHKTPSVKAETAAFLARCFAKSSTAKLPKKLLKLFVIPLLKVYHILNRTFNHR